MNCSSHRTDYLLVRLHSLGDVVLAAPAAAAMAGAGSVAFLTRTSLIPVVRRFRPGIVPIGSDGGFRALGRAAEGCGTERIADLQNNLATRIAFPRAERFRFDRGARRRVIALGQSSRPMQYRAEAFLHAAGFPEADPVPRLERHAQPREDTFRVGLVTGGRWPMKALPEGVLAELVRLYTDIDGAEVFLIGDRSDRATADRVLEMSGRRRVRNVCGEGDIETLLTRLEGMNLVVSPDSGPGHLAKALGVRTLIVFTSTSSSLGFWKPSPGDFHEVPGVPCRPCHRHGGRKCPLGVSACRKRLVPLEIHRISRGETG